MLSFYRRAWIAAGEEYGKRRAEEYGRWARRLKMLQLVVIAALVLGVVFMCERGQ